MLTANWARWLFPLVVMTTPINIIYVNEIALLTKTYSFINVVRRDANATEAIVRNRIKTRNVCKKKTRNNVVVNIYIKTMLQATTQ